MKSRAAADVLLGQCGVPHTDQVQEIWRLYFAHAQGVVRIRFHRGTPTQRLVPESCKPALKKELGGWLRSVTDQAGIDWLAVNANDVFFDRLFESATISYPGLRGSSAPAS